MKKRKSVAITVNGIQPVPIHPVYQDYSTPFMIRNQKWYDELSDPDFFTPSCPHLHSNDGHYKMNVYTGELYDIPIKKISNKNPTINLKTPINRLTQALLLNF